MSGLPEGWVKADLGAVATVASGIGFPNEHQGQTSGDLPFFKVGDISAAVLDHRGRLSTANHYVSHEVAALLKGKPVRPGATVFAKIGEAIRLSRRAYVITECLIDNNVMAVTAADERCDRYVHYFLRTVQFADVLRATTVPSLRKGDVERQEIPLAPLPEQKRIADKLDSVLERVEACRDRLDRIPVLLKRFRQSVLAAATAGRLTQDWRRNQGLTEVAAYPQVRLSSVATSRLGKMLDKAKNSGDLVPYLRNVNVRWYSFDLDDVQLMKVEPSELNELVVREGDVLVCEGGEPGRCAIWRSRDQRFVFQKALHRVRPDTERLHPEWLVHSLRFAAETRALDVLFTGTTIKHLTGVALANFTIALPSIQEQHEIVRRVETLFAFADRLEARCAAARKQAGQLTPALLAKAFRGELVPQDPADEPAAELLKRVAASRTAAPKARRGCKPVAAGE